jgi:hypothetical protein
MSETTKNAPRPSGAWRNFTPDDFEKVLVAADEDGIFCFVPVAPGEGHWLQIHKEQAVDFADVAREHAARGVGYTIHANWDGEELMIGGGGLDLGEAFKQ